MDEELVATTKYLGEPIFLGLDDKAEKLKRNLIIFSSMLIFSLKFDLSIDTSSPLLGVKLTGLTNGQVYFALLIIVVYMLLHYAWALQDAFMEWKIRLTGTRVEYITVGRVASESGDHPNNPRQSTLYNWWLEYGPKAAEANLDFGHIRQGIQESLLTLKNIEDKLEAEENGQTINAVRCCQSQINSLEKAIKVSEQKLAPALNFLAVKRIEVSLERFDRWFHYFSQSQNWRWFIFDLLMPVLLGLAAIILAIKKPI